MLIAMHVAVYERKSVTNFRNWPCSSPVQAELVVPETSENARYTHNARFSNMPRILKPWTKFARRHSYDKN